MEAKGILNKTEWSSVSLANGKSKLEKPVESDKRRKPKWLKVKLPTGEAFKKVREITKSRNLHTICESGNCPNMGECWGAGTATFMILGNICTRSCGFCAVATGRPLPVDWSEPERVARSVKLMQVKHAVITSVDRDDIKDGGSIIWSDTVKAIRRVSPGTTMETLIPDFKGNIDQVQRIVDVAPEVVSHNMETVRRLTREVRIQAKYERSLSVLKYLKKSGIRRTKSGIMLGLGEKENEVFQTLIDLKENDVDIVTLGQYLQPSKKHLPVKNYIEPTQFKVFESFAKDLGFRHVESSALVRSSYKAQKHIL